MKKNLYFLCCIVFIIGSSFYTQAQIISTYAGTGSMGYTGDGGAATLATFSAPTCIAMSSSGNLYVSDPVNNCVRKVGNTAARIITTVAGNGTRGYNGDNIPATAAQLSENWSIAVDNAGNLYIADQDNYRIRKVDPLGMITTIAGTGVSGFSGDGGPATGAGFISPFGIAVDGHGNIYVGDESKFNIRKINTSGIITTIAGTGANGYSGDGGPATLAKISSPWGIATDTAGNVYICDAANYRIRKVSVSGIITTIAGTGMPGYNGDNGPATSAKLNFPLGVFPDRSGNIYVADCYNNRIRKINAAGTITTVAGIGAPGFSGDGGLATAAEIDSASSVIMDDSGNVYIADFDNVRIREVKKINLLFFTGGHFQYINVCENEVTVPIDSILSITDYYIGLPDTWHIVSYPLHGVAYVAYSAVSTGATIVPMGLSYTPSGGYIGGDTFSVSVSDGILSDTTTIYVTVKPLIPLAGTISGPMAVCPGYSIVLSDTVTGGVWSSSNGTATVGAGGDSIITGVYPGTDTIIYAVYNNCGTGTANQIITIHPLPDTGIIAGPSNLCAGDSIVLTDTVAGGYWSSNDTNAEIISIANGVALTGVITGEDIISYTVSDSFCTASATKAITINPLPYVGSINGPSGVCAGASITMADSISGGVWGSSNGNAVAGNGTDPGTGAITGVSPGADTIIYTVSFFCGVAVATKAITIDSLPNPPAILQGGYFLSVPGGYSAYQWTLNGTEIPGATQDTLIETTAGAYAVIVSNLPGCSVSSPTINSPDCNPSEIKVYPNPSGSAINIQWCKKVMVKVIGMDGKALKVTDGANEVDIGELPDGVYLLAIFDGQGNRVMAKSITKISQR